MKFGELKIKLDKSYTIPLTIQLYKDVSLALETDIFKFLCSVEGRRPAGADLMSKVIGRALEETDLELEEDEVFLLILKTGLDEVWAECFVPLIMALSDGGRSPAQQKATTKKKSMKKTSR